MAEYKSSGLKKMETFKQYKKRINGLIKKVQTLADKALPGPDGMSFVVSEIGEIHTKTGSKVEVMQVISDRIMDSVGMHCLAIEDKHTGNISLIPVCAFRPRG